MMHPVFVLLSIIICWPGRALARNEIIDPPQFSVERGFHEKPIDVALTTPTQGAAIRFTTDGSVPTLASFVYEKPLVVSRTTCLRATAFKDGASSKTVTHTYLFSDQILEQPALPSGLPRRWHGKYPANYGMNPELTKNSMMGPHVKTGLMELPILSIVTSRDYLWDEVSGIYVNPLGHGKAYERAVSAELIQPDGSTAFAVTCGLRMQGGNSRDNNRTPKHSFRLIFRTEFGPGKLRYDWFPGSGVSRFDGVVLRASWTDSWTTRRSSADHGIPAGARYRAELATYLRDVWMKDSFRAMGQLSGCGSFVHVFLNGLYWGLYNPTERLDSSFFSHHLGGPKEAWDIIHDFSEVRDGSKADWDKMMGKVNAGVQSAQDYEAIEALVDIDNLIDYMILHIFAEAEDWPHHNWYAAHRRATGRLPETKWIFSIWDQEIVMNPDFSRNRVNVDHPDTPAHIYAQLRNWPDFRARFEGRVRKHLLGEGALTPEKGKARLMERARQVESAITAESARWGDARKFAIPSGWPDRGTGQTFTKESWVKEIARIRDIFLPKASATAIRRFTDAGLFKNPDPVILHSGQTENSP